MASNVLSKFLPPAFGSPSIYETLRQYDHSDQSDLEDGIALDEENLRAGFQDYEIGDALANNTASRMNISTYPARAKDEAWQASKRLPLSSGRPSPSPKPVEADDLDDEVPQ